MRTLIERYWKRCILFWLFPGIYWIVIPAITIKKLYVNYPIITWCFVLMIIVSSSIYARIALARAKPLLEGYVGLGNRMAILIFPAMFMFILGIGIGFALKHFIESMLT
jgi:hypothetical protein